MSVFASFFISRGGKRILQSSKSTPDQHVIESSDEVDIEQQPEQICSAGRRRIYQSGQFININCNANFSEAHGNLFWKFPEAERTEGAIEIHWKRTKPNLAIALLFENGEV